MILGAINLWGHSLATDILAGPTRLPATASGRRPAIWTAPAVVLSRLDPEHLIDDHDVPSLTHRDQSVVAVMAGNIYNTEALERELGLSPSRRAEGPGSLLVHLYQAYRDDFLKHVNGQFAVALWDGQQQRLVLGRDHLGIEPLYIAKRGHHLFFSSSLPALLQTGWVEQSLRPEAILQYLMYCYNPAPSTFWHHVSNVPAGHLVTAQRGQVREQRYWYLSFAETEVKTEATYRDEIPALMEDAIRIRLEPRQAPGIFLSGGTDSSAIVSLTTGLGQEVPATFSFRCDGPSYDESRYARLVAQQFGTKHTEVSYQPEHLALMQQAVAYMDEPFCDIGIEIATYL